MCGPMNKEPTQCSKWNGILTKKWTTFLSARRERNEYRVLWEDNWKQIELAICRFRCAADMTWINSISGFSLSLSLSTFVSGIAFVFAPKFAATVSSSIGTSTNSNNYLMNCRERERDYANKSASFCGDSSFTIRSICVPSRPPKSLSRMRICKYHSLILMIQNGWNAINFHLRKLVLIPSAEKCPRFYLVFWWICVRVSGV